MLYSNTPQQHGMDPYTKENVKKLEIVQRRAARYVLNRFNYLSSVDEMLQELQ